MSAKVKNEVEVYENEAISLINVKKPEFTGKVKVADLLSPKQTQGRDDTTSGYTVTVKRAEDFAEKMKAGAKFPPVKYMVVEDMPGNKDTPVMVLFDGFHTHAGAEIAKLDSIEAIGWSGTWTQAMAAAALVANYEHENSGKPKTYEDKIRSGFLIVKALEVAGTKKKDMPNSRQLAAMIGVSHTAVNNENILGNKRATSKTKEEIEAEKQAKRAEANGTPASTVAAGAAHLGTLPVGTKRFEIVRRATQDVVGTYDAESSVKALEAFKTKTPGAVLTEFMTRELVTEKPKAGTEKSSIGFDWQRVEHEIGSLARAADGMGDIFDLKKRPEFKSALQNLNAFAEIMKAFRNEAKKAAAKPEGEAKK